MNKVLKLQRVGLITPTLVEYDGKVLATNQLDIESTCNLWRCHFGFYPTEKIDLAMTKKEFSVIQQKTLSSVKSVYDLFYEQKFIPRVFESKEEVSEWGMYRTNEVEKLKSENATLRERLSKAVELPCGVGDKVYCIHRISNPEILEWQVNEIHITDHNYMLQLGHAGTKDYKNEASQFYGKWWFTELEAAEACLSELKGGKE